LSTNTVHGLSRSEGKAVTDSDIELFNHITGNLYTPVLSDSLDELGYREQVMGEWIRPVAANVSIAGWARTVLCMDVHYTCDDPYGAEIEAIDSILPGEVVVVATGRSRRNAPWGELLSTAAVARGARGCVTDGLIRDTRKILELGFPVFAGGTKPVDSKGRGIVLSYNIPVDCGGVVVHPGDLVVGDIDGVIVVPETIIAETVHLATDKVRRENHSRKELMEGAYLRDVYEKFGVL
jgi:4-hydroxy-4-methyl-2-oxoglutarate aldolase